MQEAFAWLLASRLLDRADPARGRFRGLLKTALANFVVERQRAARADKRGGNHVHVSLADATEVVDPNGRPDELLDVAWRRELLEGARTELQRELENNGRAAYWRVFHDWFLHEEPGVDLDHRTLARRHGITPVDVANWLAFAKQRYREILRQRVADTVQSPADLDAELHWLFGKEAR
jgi:RNA polymerase sigma-70 factor (ECF subfamily)